MITFRRRFDEIGLSWPTLSRPELPFVPSARVGDIIYISGQIPEFGQDITVGTVGDTIDLTKAQEAAQLCAANVLFWLDKALDGDASRVVRIAKVTVYVAAVTGFKEISQVANGASDLFVKVLGASGEHARSALGMAGLPLGVPVEVDAIVHVQ